MKKELLDKLNKKDKEEFIEKSKKIWNRLNFSAGLHYCRYIIYYLAFVSIALPLWFMAFEVSRPELLLAGTTLFLVAGNILLYCIILGFILDYILFITKLIKTSRLRREYFDIVPKRK